MTFESTDLHPSHDWVDIDNGLCQHSYCAFCGMCTCAPGTWREELCKYAEEGWDDED